MRSMGIGIKWIVSDKFQVLIKRVTGDENREDIRQGSTQHKACSRKMGIEVVERGNKI